MSDAAAPVVIAPFANERIKEWPARHFRRLIEMAVDDGDAVTVIGTATQRVRGNDLVRGLSAERVHNVCGKLTWSEVSELISQARYIVANNSGVAHLGARLGRFVLCIVGGAHSWAEWRPRGPRVVTVALRTACSPCEIGDGACPNGLACLVELEPEVAYRAITGLMRDGRRQDGQVSPRQLTDHRALTQL